MACRNRGLALRTRGLEGDAAAAAAAFAEAIAVLEHERGAGVSDRDFLRAVVWLKLANLRGADPATHAQVEAREAAARALAQCRRDGAEGRAGRDGRARPARHMADCVRSSRAHALSQAEDGAGMPDEVQARLPTLLTTASRWCADWEYSVAWNSSFRAVAFVLFRFGARVYARYQPQFLDEFHRRQHGPGVVIAWRRRRPRTWSSAAHEARQLIRSEEG